MSIDLPKRKGTNLHSIIQSRLIKYILPALICSSITKGDWLYNQFKALLITMSYSSKKALLFLLKEWQKGKIDLFDREKCKRILDEYYKLQNEQE